MVESFRVSSAITVEQMKRHLLENTRGKQRSAAAGEAARAAFFFLFLPRFERKPFPAERSFSWGTLEALCSHPSPGPCSRFPPARSSGNWACR